MSFTNASTSAGSPQTVSEGIRSSGVTFMKSLLHEFAWKRSARANIYLMIFFIVELGLEGDINTHIERFLLRINSTVLIVRFRIKYLKAIPREKIHRVNIYPRRFHTDL